MVPAACPARAGVTQCKAALQHLEATPEHPRHVYRAYAYEEAVAREIEALSTGHLTPAVAPQTREIDSCAAERRRGWRVPLQGRPAIESDASEVNHG